MTDDQSQAVNMWLLQQGEALQRIPPHMREALALYIVLGNRPGNFLYNVLCNQYYQAAILADEQNKHALFEYCNFLFNSVPTGAHGSVDAVEGWIGSGGSDGMEVEAQAASHGN